MKYRSGNVKGRSFSPFRNLRREVVSFGVSDDLKSKGCHSSSLRMRAAAHGYPYYRSILEGGIPDSMRRVIFGIVRQTGKAARATWSKVRSTSSTRQSTPVLTFLFRLVESRVSH